MLTLQDLKKSRKLSLQSFRTSESMSSSNVKVMKSRRRKITKAFRITTNMSMSDHSSANGKMKKRSHIIQEIRDQDQVIKTSNSSSKDQDQVLKIGLLLKHKYIKSVHSNDWSTTTAFLQQRILHQFQNNIRDSMNMTPDNKLIFESEKGSDSFDIDFNELRAERMAKNANPLALVATTQTLQDPYYQTSKPHKSYAPTSKASLPTRSHATTRYKGKEIAKPITPPSDCKVNFKKLYQTYQQPTSELPQTPKTRMWILLQGGPVVQQSGIQCFNCKEFGHYAKECRKPKQVKDSTYHKEKMLLCKQAEKVTWQRFKSFLMQTQATNAEPLEHVHYDTVQNVFANDIQHFDQSESISNTCVVETGDSNVTHDSPDMCDNDIQDDQNDVECDDEHVALANLIANLKLDVDEIKRFKSN
ncbi:retrovirus-related pol polyprotein from transposon TNT 1-94 [Tanacetum coccineum]|uniref:Retrovirus-related pol polyprotein from transposon TNT 1-94 n=1 Tax=Tanacetum coccineum TaxID=301880 RepID=A0ABQ5G2T1_9ASTR